MGSQFTISHDRITRLRSGILLTIPLIIISACSLIPDLKSRRTLANQIAADAQFESRLVDVGPFMIQTWSRGLHQDLEDLEVYIEGDGLAWYRRDRLSANPTPINPVALRLAKESRAKAILYIARPCQYSSLEDQHCSPEIWSSHRYSEAVVNGMNLVIEAHLQGTIPKNMSLIGYSGGGVIAALLAARRNDVKRLITVAANLDHAAWTTEHRVSALNGSLNPVDFADKLADIPQRHFVGEKDRIVSVNVVRSYLDKLGLSHDRYLRIVADTSHNCCWEQQWPALKQNAF